MHDDHVVVAPWAGQLYSSGERLTNWPGSFLVPSCRDVR